MQCPFCRKKESKVVDKRDSDDQHVVRRRRECLKCQKRFTTYERIETTNLIVVKKDGSREQFNRDKLKTGILKAIEKTPVTEEQVDTIVNAIESEMRKSGMHEVSTQKLGDMVMKKLIKVNEVAYVRFASVYREFKDVSHFMSEIKKFFKTRKR